MYSVYYRYMYSVHAYTVGVRSDMVHVNKGTVILEFFVRIKIILVNVHVNGN